MTTTTLELRDYYANLLIIQYLGKARAYATIQATATPFIMPQVSVQTITFPLQPTGGGFTLSYDGNTTTTVLYNDTAGFLQSRLRLLPGLGAVTVTGSFMSQLLTITFTGVTPPADLLVIASSNFTNSGNPVIPVITETDDTLPLAVQNGFNLLAPNVAVGVQLDTLGKYAGVTRYGRGFTTNITLDDADFLVLIQMAIVKNSDGSSLAQIQALIHQFFAGQMLVYDYTTMRMSYLISTGLGSTDLIQLFITEGLLPKPMAVDLSIIVAPVIDHFFGFRTYEAPAFNSEPFNDYAAYQTDWPWLSYANAIIPP